MWLDFFLYLCVFPLHDFWPMLTNETGTINWILVYFSKTGSLKRRWDRNYCHYKKQASRIQLLLVTQLHQSISPHIQRYHIKAANRETSLHCRVHTLFQECIAATEDSWKWEHRCRQKKQTNQKGIQGVKDTNPKEIKLYFPRDELFRWGCTIYMCLLVLLTVWQQDASVQGRKMNVTNVPDI